MMYHPEFLANYLTVPEQQPNPQESLDSESLGIVRFVRCYEKEGDRLIEEYPLPPIKISQLQEWFSESSTDPMVDCYPISPKEAEMLKSYTLDQVQFDLETFEYFLEAEDMASYADQCLVGFHASAQPTA